jgi:predicted MFS family arabinose efflux permease
MHRYLSRALMNARVSGMHRKAANRRKRSDQPYSDGPAGIGQEAMPIIRISPATRLFLAGNTVSMLGTGLVVAFTLIYLHQVRGIALPVVGGLLAAAGAAGLLVVPLAGILLDRIGARRVLTGILVGQAAAQVLLAWAHNAVTALPVLLPYGATWSPMFPALQTIIAGLKSGTGDPAAGVRDQLHNPERRAR